MENLPVAALPERSIRMPDDAGSTVVYEQPLSERIRSFLRLEHLFDRANHELGGQDTWSSRGTLDSLIDIMSLMGRSDVKKEVIKELERNAGTLQALATNPKVDNERLQSILLQIKEFLDVLKIRDNPPGYELRYHDFLSSVRQRSSIPAGTCDFDLPNLHCWLQSPRGLRDRDLERWLSAFDVIRDAILLCLALVRESAPATREVAHHGFYQRTLDTANPCHMIRVSLRGELRVFPEISAGRHRFTVRFMQLTNANERPIQTDQDIDFNLNCCMI